jgi:hypothetical protein
MVTRWKAKGGAWAALRSGARISLSSSYGAPRYAHA